MDFSYLKGAQLKDTKARNNRPKEPTSRNPEGLSVRIYHNGKVYPSAELVNKFNLEYTSTHYYRKDSNGFDVIDSTAWKPLENQPRAIIFGLVSRDHNKIDLFSMTKHDENGNPITSVLTQGNVCQTLLDLVRSMGYLNEGENYADLQIHEEYEFSTENGVSYIPKTVERGDRKGAETYERRDNVRFFPVSKITATSAAKKSEDLTTGEVLQETYSK